MPIRLRPGLAILLVLLAPAFAGGCARAACPAEAVMPVAACASSARPAAARVLDDAPDPHLVGFSRATCLALYLHEKGWDAESARNIAGGYVELGTRSAEAYQALASFIRAFEPPLGSQQPIDEGLTRCFQIEDDAEWQRLVRAH